MNYEFRFKQFGINHSCSSMKIGTDAVLLGALTHVEQVDAILEIGCGCGIISLMLAQRCDANIVGIDIHENSVKQANENFKNSPWSNRLTATLKDARNFNSKKKFDLIVSNPPYYTNSLLPETKSKQIAHHHQTLNFSELCNTVTNNLNSYGSFWLILPNSMHSIYSKEATKFNLFCNIKIEISDKPNKPISLIISSWSFKLSEINIKKFELKNSDESYAEMYKKTMSDFYISL